MLPSKNLLPLFIVAIAAMLFVGCKSGSPTPSALTLVPDAQPGSDWTRAVAPGWSDQGGFSLLLPPGWELKELQGIDSYVGEVSGDGITLNFDYGMYSWPLNPDDEREHEYIVSHEEIGGREAKLLLPAGAPSSESATYEAATGIYFGDLGGRNALNLVGRGLDLEKQRVAVAIFRSIRLPD